MQLSAHLEVNNNSPSFSASDILNWKLARKLLQSCGTMTTILFL